MKWIIQRFICLFCMVVVTQSFDYSLNPSSPEVRFDLIDVETGISNIKTLFIHELTSVSVKGISWVVNDVNETNKRNHEIIWTTYVDGIEVDDGTFSLVGVRRELPTQVSAGSFEVYSRGIHNITVRLVVDDSELIVTEEYNAYKMAVSIVPLLVVLLLAILTNMIELSLFLSIFFGSCIISGNLKNGFKDMLSKYFIDALADTGHCYVVLFTIFLAGLISLMEKSGGMNGFTNLCSSYATNDRTAQLVCFGIGILIFFDEYMNILLAGQTMKQLFDIMMISREKLAFIIDATSLPMVALSPISSWIGFEIALIQPEINRIIQMMGTDDIGIKTSGLGVFLRSIQYQYYSIYLITLVFFLIVLRRDCGPMLYAERKVKVYERTDGGDGKGDASAESCNNQVNKPNKGTKLRAYNMLIPLAILIGLIFYLIIETGTIEGIDQTIMDKIENSDSYMALLWGTMGTIVCTILLYLLQWYTDTKEYSLPPFESFYILICQKESNSEHVSDSQSVKLIHKIDTDENIHDEDLTNCQQDIDDYQQEDVARPLISIPVAVDSFLRGMSTIFPALIVLVLAWAISNVMIDVGANRLFTRWIVNGIKPELLPTLTFLISFIIALSTGSAWGAMSILYPLVLVPTYVSSNGNPSIFYAVTGSILNGAIAGNHVSPISDMTIISSMSSDCSVMQHVITRTPYFMITIVIAILVGTLPAGYEIWPSYVSIILGTITIVLFVCVICAPILDSRGRFDVVTELYLRFVKKDCKLEELRDDTIIFYTLEQIDFQDSSSSLPGKEPNKDTWSEDWSEVSNEEEP